jgi:Ca2+-binding EF-hand superfamily protein/pimeloyl-ACP methyl ester carboxylesterase
MELPEKILHGLQTQPRLEPLELHVMQSFGLRTKPVKKEDANILSGLELEYGITDFDGGSVPEQIRDALAQRYVRVIDLFRQWDDDASGCVTMREFMKAMRDMGLDAPDEVVASLFLSMDEDGSNTIEYEELHNLLVRSVQNHPDLEPLELHAMNAIGLRTATVNKDDANILQGFVIDEDSLDSVPHQIRCALHKHKVRVIDLFRQIDDDASGLIDLPEFVKAMGEFGLQGMEEEVKLVFNTFDADRSGRISYAELETLCRASVNAYPRMYLRRGGDAHNHEQLIAELLRLHPELANKPEFKFKDRWSMVRDKMPAYLEEIRVEFTLGDKVLEFMRQRKQAARPVEFNEVTLHTRSGEPFTAYQMVNVPASGANRGSDKLVIVTHPITGAGGDAQRDPLRRLSNCALHRHLRQQGFSVLAYEAHPLNLAGQQTGELQEELLLGAMDHVGTHRSFKYCKIALMAQGVGAAAAFVAMSRHPEVFDNRVLAISACQPAAVDGPAFDELLNTHVPRCKVPTLLSHSDVNATHYLTDTSVAESKVADAIHDALDASVPKHVVEVSDAPLYGAARRFDGSQYFGDNPQVLEAFEEMSFTPKGKRGPWAHF